jgi:hypothetical protein
MSIIVYWIQETPSEMFPSMSEPKCKTFEASQLTEALAFTQKMRNEVGVHHVSLCSENPDNVGKPGVLAFVGFQADGVTPYDWKKRRI